MSDDTPRDSHPRCPNCGTLVLATDAQCPHCGHPLKDPPAETAIKRPNPKCPNCGAEMPPGARACPQCGRMLAKAGWATRIVVLLAFIVIGLPAGLGGACAIIVAGSYTRGSGTLFMILLGLAALALAVFLAWALARTWRD